MEAFARQLRDAVENGSPLVLSDPAWPAEWRERLAAVASEYIRGNQSVILIPTSGTTGLPKYCIHTSNTLLCAARAYADRFGRRGIIHSVNILPTHHVGGLMPLLRAEQCGGSCHFADYRQPDTLAAAPFPLDQTSLSVVPTQLRRMLADARTTAVLRRFGILFTGGAACPADLLEQARREQLRLSPCYGSTETAAMVTALDPEEFLAGADGVGTPMPHARIEVDKGQRVLVYADSITIGYLPAQEGFSRDPFITGDLGTIDSKGHLHILGRADRVIISGGENVNPELVECAALATGLVRSARCTGAPDPDWGMRVELSIFPFDQGEDVRDRVLQELKKRLPSNAVPKFIHVRKDATGPRTLKDGPAIRPLDVHECT